MERKTAREALSSSSNVWCELDRGSGLLVVAFAGHVRRGNTRPELGRTLAAQSLDTVQLTDPRGLWYLSGVAGVGSIEETAAILRRLRDEVRPRRVICCGNSAGGFAAILFGVLIGADCVLAISPQVDMSDLRYVRFPEARERIRRAPDIDHRYLDLRPIVASSSGATRICVHYAALNRRDSFHGHRLEGLPGVQSFRYLWPAHGLVYLLRERGDLARMIEAAACERDHRARPVFGPALSPAMSPGRSAGARCAEARGR